MLTSDPHADTLRKLFEVEAKLADLPQEQERLQGQRDKLLAELLDSEGAHDRRPVGVR